MLKLEVFVEKQDCNFDSIEQNWVVAHMHLISSSNLEGNGVITPPCSEPVSWRR